MLLCVIRPNAEYTVCAVPDDGPCSQCQVIVEINGLFPDHQQLHGEVWKRLYLEIPVRGLPEVDGMKPLRDGIQEFRFGRLPGMAFRVLWFEGESPKEIVCSNAFAKELRESTPDQAINRATWHRHSFLAAVTRGQIRRQDMRPEEL